LVAVVVLVLLGAGIAIYAMQSGKGAPPAPPRRDSNLDRYETMAQQPVAPPASEAPKSAPAEVPAPAVVPAPAPTDDVRFAGLEPADDTITRAESLKMRG